MDKGAIPGRIRIYCETLPFEELVRPYPLALLRRHPFQLVLAIRPWQLAALPAVVRTLADSGIACSLWPMLSDDDGRWANAHNAGAFARLVLGTVDALDAAGLVAEEVLLDLEPSFAHARALASLQVGELSARPTSNREMKDAVNDLAPAVTALHARGIATASAVWPLVALDAHGERGWQTLLGTPVDALGTERVSVMMYTSIFEGWSRGAVRRRDATALLSAATSRAVRRWGTAAGMSLGCVGTGALVDEPVYRDPSELAEDAALARAAGCHDLSLFDLGGVIGRAPAEAWLDAFAHGAELATGGSSKRVRLVRRLSRVATWALRRRS